MASKVKAFLNAIDEYKQQAAISSQPDDVNEMKNFLKENGLIAKYLKLALFRGLK